MPEILHELRIASAPEDVYDAIATEDGLREWWTRDTESEDVIGGLARFGFQDRATLFVMRIDILDEPNEVRWRCEEGHPEWEGTILEFHLREKGRGTVLRFNHRGWGSTEGILARCSYDWAKYLRSLASYLETGRGQPHEG